MTPPPIYLGGVLMLVVIFFAGPLASAAEELPDWRPAEAGRYLDEREKTWFGFSSARRGQGTEQTSCVSCHTVMPYVLARPVLRKLAGALMPTEQEKKLLTQTRKRVENWQNLDNARFGLLYDFNEQKKKEAWGTEAVLNAVICAFDDHYQGRSGPSDVTKQAFANLWKAQIQTGDRKGTWDWLDFGLEPWESKGARYHGAALAAIAVGTAPGYYTSEADADVSAKVKLLRDYLKDGLRTHNLFNRTLCLWVSAKLDGVLTRDDQREIIGQLLDEQRSDGGWNLASLGPFVRRDGTTQDGTSDGYATGLVLHVVQLAGLPKDNARLARGLAWLKSNQAATGEWRGISVNKKRNPASHVGKFMSDAATAYAVLALSH
jgi:squalene-hopene/tetraprenyl-beta-curcumene cyclase